MLGVRKDDRVFEVGEEVPYSRVWDDGEVILSECMIIERKGDNFSGPAAGLKVARRES